MVQKAIETTRNLTVEIEPPVLKHEGLVESLRWLRNHMKKSFGLDVEIVGECPSVNKEMRGLLFRLARELLFNVVKHAGVSQSRVEIQERDGNCLMRIIDGGVGFDPANPGSNHQSHAHLGLTSASERVKLFGGSLEVDSVPKEGTTVTVRLPVGSSLDEF
jgi:signal transduction histidine kinase